jgi:hypothetical protein
VSRTAEQAGTDELSRLTSAIHEMLVDRKGYG